MAIFHPQDPPITSATCESRVEGLTVTTFLLQLTNLVIWVLNSVWPLMERMCCKQVEYFNYLLN